MGHNRVTVCVFCRTADVSNAQVSGGTPVPAPAKSTAQVVEVRRKFKVKRNDTAAALA